VLLFVLGNGMDNSKNAKVMECSRVISAFNEHEKGLREVLRNLYLIAEDRAKDKTFSGRIREVEEHFLNVKDEISNIISSICSSASGSKGEHMFGPPVIIRCKQWEDFKFQATDSTAVSFLYKAEERAFQVDALKEGKVYTFSGQMPNDTILLRRWLAKELNMEESKVMEGVLGIG
jgi:hypothetical protein